MNARTFIPLALVVAVVAAGCQKSVERHNSSDAVKPAPPPTVSQSAPSTPPEAVPKNDPSLPSASAAFTSQKTATDASPETAVTATERDKAMPLPGQANDHSNPEFAKRAGEPAPPKSP